MWRPQNISRFGGRDIPLLFLFSGSVFYESDDGRLQVQRISWNKECFYNMPLELWQNMMEHHFPKSAGISAARRF